MNTTNDTTTNQKQKHMKNELRRCDANFRTPEENLIHLAIELVERMPADERLSKAVASLADAKRYLADYIDNPETK